MNISGDALAYNSKIKYNKKKAHTRDNILYGKISGFNDAVFLRNTYQVELDNAYEAIVKMVHYLEKESKRLKGYHNATPAIKKNIESHQQERHDLYTALGNLLNSETNFEKEMWKTTQESQNISTIHIKQKFTDSDVDEMRYNSMLQYLKRYPRYASKSTYSELQQKIEEKERGILREKKRYTEAVSNFNFNLSLFQKNIQKAEDKFIAYYRILDEGTNKLKGCRYNNSIFCQYASEKTKAMVNLNTLSHRVEQFRNTLILIKEEILKYQEKPVELDY